MVASGGLFGALQRHLGRVLAYAAIAETGLFLVILGLSTSNILEIVFLALIPRGLELSIWALALSIIKRKAYPLKFNDIQGLMRKYPVASSSLILAHLSVAGFPLLAGFPSRIALWQALSAQSLAAAFWVFLGLAGLLTSAFRTLAAMVMSADEVRWELNETWAQIFMLGVGVLGLFALGLFPQFLRPFISSLPLLFEHLAQ